ncbi:MAG: CusA/CzcA family heavy metal efflux RND transporter [Verrucomicrobiales bacterium]|jgi:Cu(I)/Ag(I) efflux system membrane protein CusA/SilA|nr:CusA/CzcA family heavy metal efflux RND transporter [Verrucomicrobiales bacterium]
MNEPPLTMIEKLTVWSGRNPLLVCILVFIGVAWGWHSLRVTPLDAIPDLSDTQVIVYTNWEGRNPTLIEEQITYPISSLFISAPKVKSVRGESIFGKSFVYVIFEDGTDIYWARSRVLEYLNQARAALPVGVNPQIGPDASSVGWVFQYALVDESGRQDLASLRTFQDWTLRFALGSVKGVSEVAAVGGFVRQYQINLDPNKLVGYGVSLREVADAVQRNNRDSGGKTVEVANTEFYVRGQGYFKSAADIEQVAVKADANGSPVLIRQLGAVTVSGDMRQGLAEFNGRGETVGGIVIMRHGENALDVIKAVKARLKSLAPSFPAGVKVVPVYDRAELIERSIDTLKWKLIEESLIVSLVCVVFLWHLRSALVAVLMLPTAIVLSFIPFRHMGLTANIMSLGGIAIAIGAMIDAAIVMIENAHKQLEHAADGGADVSGERRREIILQAARQVGRPLFFSLLVITVSFTPIFYLDGQSGRLFQPLAFTKTFSMLFAALLSVTLVPVLMTWFIRGKIKSEKTNPVNWLLITLYRPVVEWVLRFRWATLTVTALVLLSTWWPIARLGSEFMPPLNEGAVLYMPTAVPGMAVSEASRVLNWQDRVLMKIPEVLTVFGKAGQAETATDPAPLSMFETVVQLKPREQWRAGLTWAALLDEMDAALKTPGMGNVFQMPIQTRTQMLSTGFRSNLGIKIYGQDLTELNRLGEAVERSLTNFPGVRSVYADRITGGRYLDITADREALARYGLSVEEVNDAVEFAIGGNTLTTAVAGRERYPVAVRYAPDFRNDITALRQILLTTPAGAKVPLAEVARIDYNLGPAMIRSEHGQLVNFVTIDSTAPDVVGFVEQATAHLNASVPLPAGSYFEWAGTFENLLRAKETLTVIIPFTLLIIFLLIYLNTKSAAKTCIVLLAVPFSLVGAFWLLWLCGYNLSVAAAVGLIALAGIDAETGIVMLLYLDHAYDDRQRAGRMHTVSDLLDAIREGAVQRIRPKMMTVSAILLGLLPILWSAGVGADVMKPIAAPMIGGVVTSAAMELLVYPVIFYLWRKRTLPSKESKE